MSTATSSSDRYAEARKVLEKYDAAIAGPDDDPGYHKRMDAALDCIEPFRALIEPAAVDESVEEIAAGIQDRVYRDWLTNEADPRTPDQMIYEAAELAVQAGVQAAWLSWEPDDYAPKLCAKCGGDA